MSFTAGTYSLPGPALNTGDTVSATENNTFRNDVATAFNLTMLRNGTSTATANLPMGGFKLTGLGNGTASGDSLAYGQTADANIYGITLGRGAGAVSTNTAVGASALAANTGAANTAIGASALIANTSGANSTAVGNQAGYSNTTGEITAIGEEALKANTTGAYNTAVGVVALLGNTTGSSNTAVGRDSLRNNTTASNNTAVGYQAMNNSSTGSGNNTALGYQAGYSIGTGANNICIGRADVSVQNVTHEITIATAGVGGKGANTAFISANGGSTYNGANTTTWATTSDQRIKKNIFDVSDALTKIAALRPVEFDYKENDKHEVGFIAQEYQQVLPDQIIHHSANPAEKEWVGEDEVMAIQQNLVPYLVKAIQELKAEFDAYKEAHK